MYLSRVLLAHWHIIQKACSAPARQMEPRVINSPNTRISALILGVILLVGILLRLVSFHGYAGSDDGSYTELAYALSTGRFRVGEYSGPPVFPLRVGVFAPVALLFRIFGPSEAAVIAYPFFLSMGGILLAYYAGQMIFNRTAGLIAAALQALVPLASRSATILMPDLPAAFWANIGVLFFYMGARGDSVRKKLVLGALGGLALGVSWLCKETVAYLAPFLLLACAYLITRSGENWKLAAAMAAGAGVVVLGETLVYALHTGDPFYRIHETHRNYEYNRTWFFAEGSRFGWKPGQYHLALVKRLLRDGPQTLLASPSFGGVTAVAALAVLHAWFYRHRSFTFVGLWFVTLLLVFNFGSANLIRYQPLVLFDKYAYPLVFPACLLCAGFLSILMAGALSHGETVGAERRFWAAILATGLGAACLVSTSENVLAGRKSTPERLAAARISPSDPLFTDRRTLRILEFFWSFPKQAYGHDFQGLTEQDIPGGSYVLINLEKLRFLADSYDYAIPSFCEAAPAEWEVVAKSGGATLYRTPGGRRAESKLLH